MGTDIHPAVEVRRKGMWRLHRPTTECPYYYDYDYDQTTRQKVWKLDANGERIRSPWDRCKTRLPDCFHDRNYSKFAVLGDVRNGYGFAGIETHEPLPVISSGRGVPPDVDPKTLPKLSNEHSATWVSLQELLDYDLTIPLHERGVVSEEVFLDCMINRKDPESWSGDISGPDIVVVTPAEYLDLHRRQKVNGFWNDGNRAYDPTKRYYVRMAWTVPLATSVPDILEMIEYLKPLVPKGGTPDDVRVVMDFDS